MAGLGTISQKESCSRLGRQWQIIQPCFVVLILFLGRILLRNWANCRSPLAVNAICWANSFAGQLIVLVNINQPTANISGYIDHKYTCDSINNCVIAYLTNWHLKLMSGAVYSRLQFRGQSKCVYTRHVIVCVCVCLSVIPQGTLT